MRLSVTILSVLALLAGPARAWAGDLADFNAAIEAASAHNRVAIGYLRTGNGDLAGLELDRLRDAWQKVTARFSGHRPDVFDGNPLYTTVFTGVSARLVAADMMLNAHKLAAARQALIGMRDDLHALRQKSGIVVLADCFVDANQTMDALMAFNKKDIDWAKPETRYAIAGTSAIYGHILDRCDAMAGDTIRKDPEFRRLVDGAHHSLTFMPQAIANRDTNLLHRVLIELRAFDYLLAFRYG